MYDGELDNNNKKNGFGVLYAKNGDTYRGQFKDDLFEGKGFIHYNDSENDGDKYDGEWQKGAKSGKGIYVFANGDMYDGFFQDNKYEG